MNARFHVCRRSLKGASIVEYHAALAGCGGAAFAGHGHIAHNKIVRRIVRDGNLCVSARRKASRAGYGIRLEMDIPELGRNVADGEIVGETLVRHRMEEGVLFAFIGVRRHFLAIQVEMTALFCASILYESICCRHLVLLIGDALNGAAIDSLFRNKSVPFGLDDRGIEAGRIFGVIRLVRRIVGIYLALVTVLRGLCCGLRFLILTACRIKCRIGCREGRICLSVGCHCCVVIEDYLLRSIRFHVIAYIRIACILCLSFYLTISSIHCTLCAIQRALRSILCRESFIVGRLRAGKRIGGIFPAFVSIPESFQSALLRGRFSLRGLILGEIAFILGKASFDALQFGRIVRWHADELAALGIVAQALLDELGFDEIPFRLVRRHGGRVAFQVLQLIEALEEIGPDRNGFPDGVGNLAVPFHIGDPLPGEIAIAVLFRFAPDGDGEIPVDTGLRFAFDLRIGIAQYLRLSDLAALRAEGFADRIHPVLHFAVAGRVGISSGGLEINIPVAPDGCVFPDKEIRIARDLRGGILIDRNRNGRGVQDISIGPGGDGPGRAGRIPACSGADIAERCLRLAVKGGLCHAVVGHVVFRACVAGGAEYVHYGFAQEVRVILCTDADRAAAVGSGLPRMGSACSVFFLLIERIGFFRIARLEIRAGRYGDGGVRFGRIGVLDMRRAHGGAGGDGEVVLCGDITSCVDGNGVLVVDGLAVFLLFVGESRRGGRDGDLSDVCRCGVGDGRGIHDAASRGKGRAAGEGVQRRPAAGPVLLALVFREHRGGAVGLDDRAVADGRLHSRVYGDAQVRAGAAVLAGADRFIPGIYDVIVARFEGEASCADLYILSKTGSNVMVEAHVRGGHSTCDDAACAGDGVHVGSICRRVFRPGHFGPHLHEIASSEGRAVADCDRRRVIGRRFGDSDADARKACAGRRSKAFNDRRIPGGNGNISAGALSVLELSSREGFALADKGFCIYRRRQIHTGAGAAEETCGGAGYSGGELRICCRSDRDIAIRLHFAGVLSFAFFAADPRFHSAFRVCSHHRAVQRTVKCHCGAGEDAVQCAVIVCAH